MFCWKCGDDNPKHYRFCGCCGAPARKPDQGDPFELPETSGSGPEWFGGAGTAMRTAVEKMLQAGSFTSLMTRTTGESHGFQCIQRGEKTRIVYRDASGNTKTYRSREEMPPELRQRFDAALALGSRPKEAADHPFSTCIDRGVPQSIPIARPVQSHRSLRRSVVMGVIAIAVLYWLLG
ncbi:MAG: hypothetical protein ACE5EC_06935 [Phycisphaerae bacterium]